MSDAQQEAAAIVIYEAFVQRMGGPWDGKDSSMAAQLCWASAGEIFRRIQLPPALTAARIEGVREGLERTYAIAKLEEGAGGDFKELLTALEKIVMDNRALADELNP